MSPWITKGLIKSSKRKQKLYEKYLKNKTYKNQTNYKIYKNLFEKTKIRSEKLHYSNLILKYQNNIKKHGKGLEMSLEKQNSYPQTSQDI